MFSIQKLVKLRIKFSNNSECITTEELNKLTEEHFAARLKQADLVNKTDFDNKIASFNGRITSNKTKHLEIQKKLNCVITNCYSFFLGRIYFTSNDAGRKLNRFYLQPR